MNQSVNQSFNLGSFKESVLRAQNMKHQMRKP